MERIYGVMRLSKAEQVMPTVAVGEKLKGSDWFKFLEVISPSKDECLEFVRKAEFIEMVVISILKREVILIKRFE